MENAKVEIVSLPFLLASELVISGQGQGQDSEESVMKRRADLIIHGRTIEFGSIIWKQK